MEGLGPPQGWIGREVRVVLQGRIPDEQGRSGSDFDTAFGVLAGANEIGLTLEEAYPGTLGETVDAGGAARVLSFIPWPAVRGIRLVGES